jgi:hypothetical protein
MNTKMNTLLKRNNLLGSILLFLLAITLASSVLVSCKRPGEGRAIVTVVDTLNMPVAGATVELTSRNNPNKPGDVNFSQATDLDGKAYFSNKLEVILQVEAKKGTLKSTKENIHIIPDEVAVLTVTIR